jgi:N-acetylglucosamine transport system substrate-binding protein
MMNMNNLAQTHEILTPQLATKVGLTKFEFYKYVKANEYEQVGHGVYAAKDTWIDELDIVTDGVYNMNDIYQEGTFMVFGWDAMPDTSKVVIADSVFNVASDVMNGDMTAEQWRDGIEAAFEEIAASK